MELFEPTNTQAFWMVIKKEKLLLILINLMFKWQIYYIEMKLTTVVPFIDRQDLQT